MSVYKQLFRAAKAKQKLKLRVSVPAATEPEEEEEQEEEQEEEEEETKSPKPVTVEDEPEGNFNTYSAPAVAPQVKSESPKEEPASPASTPAEVLDTIAAPQVPDEFPSFIKQWRGRGMPRIHLRRDADGVEVIDFLGKTVSTTEPMVTLEDPITEQSSSLDKIVPPGHPEYRFSATASTLPFSELWNKAYAASSSSPKLEEIKEQKTEESTPAANVEEVKAAMQFPAFNGRFRRPFTVFCNSCDQPVPDAHFHCSTCDDGDFDLCQNCVNRGISCYNDQHWLIKRTIKEGKVAYSTTHIAPKLRRAVDVPKPAPVRPEISLSIRPAEKIIPAPIASLAFLTRTCNSCVQEFLEKDFLHCNTCDDYDLCKVCFIKDQHGHHPNHGFAPAVKGTTFETAVYARLSPGRNVSHNAICDGCDLYIRGIRHKCLDCPDWDYCSECVQNAGFIHPNHRFAPIYEPLKNPATRVTNRFIHTGICCDGPLCTSSQSGPKYITGVRYKCAVCNDTDFCASCEASPANNHNKTHPLIMFKTPIRHVSVTTMGEHEDGQRLPPMGDRRASQRMSSRSTETIPSPGEVIAVNPVQTVVDVKPTAERDLLGEKVDVEPTPVKVEEKTEKEQKPDLVAVFMHDTVQDGTVMPPNHTFEQTWVLRNNGKVAWPAGCSVKYVGGDYMGAVDPTRPMGTRELISASESTVCYNQLQPSQEFPFTVLMRTPEREGKVISYWRLTTPDGITFGHKLWCDVTVETKVKEEPKDEEEQHESLLDTKVPEMTRSHMIIPKLDHESAASSVHVAKTESEIDATTETDTVAPSVEDNEDDFEDCAEDDGWAEELDEGFMTDEEYDILDASDEEYLFEQQKKVLKK
jgi:next to BRCA1 gene 1 protein